MNIKEGDLWFATVYFEDQPEVSKARPILILSDEGDTVKALKATSQVAKCFREYDYVIQDWKGAGLLKPTGVRAGALLQIPKDDLKFRIGHLQEEDLNNIYYLLAQRMRYTERLQSFDESISHITKEMPLREKLTELMKCGVSLLEAAEICEIEFGEKKALREAAMMTLNSLPIENSIVNGKVMLKDEGDWEW